MGLKLVSIYKELNLKLIKNLFISLIALTFFSSASFASFGHFDRLDAGVAITKEERDQATDELISLLKEIKYFDFIDSRVHGSPESDTSQPFWWATMWTGVKVTKLGGQVTYLHGLTGSDNAGIQTSPFLEDACYAYQLTGNQKYAHLARRLMRGMSSWILASSRSANESPKLLFRAFYPTSVFSTDNGRDIFINYNANRPGVDGVPSQYVHNPNNPYFGDIWLKNNRSVDDLGHMITAIAHLQGCRDIFDQDAKKDLDMLNKLYSDWAQNVESNRFIIPSLNKNLEMYIQRRGLGDYSGLKIGLIDPFCVGKLAVRFLHSDTDQNLDCGKGYTVLEKMFARYLQNDAIQIIRTHHVAAIAMAELKSQHLLATKLREGLVERMNRDLKVARNQKLSPKFDIQDIASFLIQAHNTGVSMTSDEIRFVYERLHTAYQTLRSPAYYNTFHLFDSSVPDGEYSFDPPHIGLYFYAIGSMLGTCTSTLVNPEGRQVLNCERLKKEFSKFD